MVFPYVEKEVCGQSIRHVANAAEEIAQVRSYLQEATIEAEKDIVEKMEKAISIRWSRFPGQNAVNAFSGADFPTAARIPDSAGLSRTNIL